MNPLLVNHFLNTKNANVAVDFSHVKFSTLLYKAALVILVAVLIVRVVFWVTHIISKILCNTKINESDARFNLRVKTVSNIINGLFVIIACVYAPIVLLNTLGINIIPIITGIGFLGLAITFGAQNLVKDIINGFFILFEDQFGVGDVIKVGDLSGLVEDMNLRITTLRDAAGNVHIIPNGEIKQVTIMTKLWSKASVEISVFYNQDIPKIIELLKVEADKLAFEFKDEVLEPPEVLGVEKISGDMAVLKVSFKTTPFGQWRVTREFNIRILSVLNLHNIKLCTDAK